MEPLELMQMRMFAELIVAVTVWPLLLGMFLVIGSRQSSEGGGSAGRLWLVAAAAATLAALPMLIWILVVLPPYSGVSSFPLAAALTCFSAVLVGLHVGRPVRIIASSAALPLVHDADFLARVSELSWKMGIDPPRVRLLGSATDSLDTSAFVGGLPAPMVVMTDGAMYRLQERERDAVLAHELAHIATGSLWWLASIAPMAAVGGSFTSAFLPAPVAAFVAIALYVGLGRMIGRRIEIVCDRAAAEAMGHREMSVALSKIHAAHVMPDKGWLSFLAYATATHPSLATRLAALKAAAPPEERDEIEFDAEAAGRQKIATAAAGLMWLFLMAAAGWLGRRRETQQAAVFLLLTVSATPMLLTWFSIAKKMRVASRRVGGANPIWLLLLLGPAAVLVARMASSDWNEAMFFLALFAVVLAIVFAATRWTQRLHADVVAAIRAGDFRRAVELGESNPRRVRKDPKLRHNVALARALCGDRRRAIEELRQLAEDTPKFLLTRLTLAALLLEEDPQEALDEAQRARTQLKRDAAPLVTSARALRRLGRLQEADAAIREALELAPEEGPVLAVAAGIALDLGQTDRARELLKQALRHAPGDAFCLVAAAEVALETGTPAEAHSAVQKAAAGAAHNPLALLGGEISRLRNHPAVVSHFTQAEEVLWVEDAVEE